jgi:hypothetical protein
MRRSLVGNTHATVWFQQDGAKSHTARMSMEKLREMFPHRMPRFRHLNWPPRSPDFSALDFFLWGYLKSRVFKARPDNLDELKASIREAIHDVIQRVVDDSTKRLQGVSLQKEGIYSILFRKVNCVCIILNFHNFSCMLICHFYYLLSEIEFIHE